MTAKIMSWHNQASEGVRPILTYFFAFIYMTVSTYGVITNRIDFTIYFSQIGTMVAMMISYYFGEKSALKDPKKDGSDGR